MDDWPANEKPTWFEVVFESVFLLLLCYWSYFLLFTPHPWILLDGVNLLIHEAGHMIFLFAGMFIHMIAGSLVQVAVPLSFTLYFYMRRSHMGAAFSLFWSGDSLINVSEYMKDANAMMLDLIGGGIHDWNWIFAQTGLLDKSQIIGNIAFFAGATLIVGSLMYAAGIIVFQINNILRAEI